MRISGKRPYQYRSGRMNMLFPNVPKYPTQKDDVQTEHPLDSGISVWDTAKFDIDEYEDD